MREFVSFEALARIWKCEQSDVRRAADASGILCFTLQGRAHADRRDTERLGEAVHRKEQAA